MEKFRILENNDFYNTKYFVEKLVLNKCGIIFKSIKKEWVKVDSAGNRCDYNFPFGRSPIEFNKLSKAKRFIKKILKGNFKDKYIY